jgi:hypothetical protein
MMRLPSSFISQSSTLPRTQQTQTQIQTNIPLFHHFVAKISGIRVKILLHFQFGVKTENTSISEMTGSFGFSRAFHLSPFFSRSFGYNRQIDHLSLLLVSCYFYCEEVSVSFLSLEKENHGKMYSTKLLNKNMVSNNAYITVGDPFTNQNPNPFRAGKKGEKLNPFRTKVTPTCLKSSIFGLISFLFLDDPTKR